MDNLNAIDNIQALCNHNQNCIQEVATDLYEYYMHFANWYSNDDNAMITDEQNVERQEMQVV